MNDLYFWTNLPYEATKYQTFLQVLYAQDTDQRSVTFEKAIEMAKIYEERARMLILRSAILKSKVVVKTDSQGQVADPESGFPAN